MSNPAGNGKPQTYLDAATQSEILGDAVSESHAVVRETVYNREMDIAYLVGLLRNQRVTGTLRIDISQGTVNAVRLEERKKL